MSADVFCGADSIQTITKKSMKKDMQKIQIALGLEHEYHIVILCAAVGLYKTSKGGKKQAPPGFTKLTNISVFEDKKLYDRIIKYSDGKDKPMLSDFNEYVFTGFKIVDTWFTNYQLSDFKIDAWSNFIKEILDDNDPLQNKFKPKQS